MVWPEGDGAGDGLQQPSRHLRSWVQRSPDEYCRSDSRYVTEYCGSDSHYVALRCGHLLALTHACAAIASVLQAASESWDLRGELLWSRVVPGLGPARSADGANYNPLELGGDLGGDLAQFGHRRQKQINTASLALQR